MLELLDQTQLDRLDAGVVRHPLYHEAGEVGRKLEVTLLDRTYPARLKQTAEEAVLEDDVLAGSVVRPIRLGVRCAEVIGSEEDEREADVLVCVAQLVPDGAA